MATTALVLQRHLRAAGGPVAAASVVAGAGLVLAVTAYASVAGSEDEYSGCVNDDSGVLRMRTRPDGVTVLETCRNSEVPVNGYPLVDGENLYGNPKASHSIGDTGEPSNGFQVEAFPGFGRPGGEPVAGAREVTAAVRCLKDRALTAQLGLAGSV